MYHAKPTTSANQTTKILGFIDKKGEIVIPIQYDNAWFFQTAWQM
ncbi:WG repeat-containing protein [Moraxella bovis]